MFSGIIQNIGRVVSRSNANIQQLCINTPLASQCALGDSMAVNGVCLTVTSIVNHILSFDMIPETQSRTNLIHLQAGDPVNCELALRASDFIGGHQVQGHIDNTGIVKSLSADNVLTITLDASLACQLTPKGFVAVNGASLTLVDIADNYFTVALIPHTIEHSIAKHYTAGSIVNIEIDILSKTIFHMLENQRDAHA